MGKEVNEEQVGVWAKKIVQEKRRKSEEKYKSRKG